ncbi:MAG: hypothetical protein ABIJ97_15765 [Bacteroidota bacterium]
MKSKEFDIVEIIASLLRLFKKRFILFIILLVICYLIGVLRIVYSKNYYSSELVLNSNMITNYNLSQYINNLNIIILNKDYQRFSKILDLDETVSKKIKSINSEVISDEQVIVSLDKNNNIEGFNSLKVNLSIYDSLYIDTISEKIVNYLNKIEFVSNIYNIKRKNSTEIIAKIDEEIAELDSLQKINYFDKNVYISSGSHKELIDMYELKLKYSENLGNPVIKITSSTPVNKNPGASIVLNFVIFSILAFLIYFIITFIIEFSRKLNQHDHQT